MSGMIVTEITDSPFSHYRLCQIESLETSAILGELDGCRFAVRSALTGDYLSFHHNRMDALTAIKKYEKKGIHSATQQFI